MKIFLTIIIALICSYSLNAQFDIEAYKEYLSTHKDMSFDGLIKEYPAGNFLKEAPTDFLKSYYADSIKTNYELTNFEISLINKHSFMVTERYQYPSFLFAFWNIYNRDLPVYISSDAILHALHFSFDVLLKRFENEDLNDLFIDAINKMEIEIPNLETDCNDELYKQALLDLDLYLSITQYLLTESDNLYYKENQENYDLIKKLINLKTPCDISLFCNQKRLIDFSQFQVRGHYTENKKLQRYFQAMTWLGRTEILLSKPQHAVGLNFSDEDIQRMTILATLINEVANKSGAIENIKTIDQILTFLLGEQDNIKINEIDNIMTEMDLKACDLTDVNNLKTFSEKVLTLKSAQQLYNSQILFSGGTQQIVIPSVFLLLGQRPIIDAYIASNVVYDKVLYNGYKVRRMIPSTSDILFALGNDASIQLLESELKKFNYSSNLASLRYLIDGYDDKFWQSTTYTNWLNSIRSLNPPKNRESLPLFMQTAAWWQKTMNTQLSSWAELRHDFLLYAKQSYTAGIVCSYPKAYIEPIPQFYASLKNYFIFLKDILKIPYLVDKKEYSDINSLCENWISSMDKLNSISKKILKNEPFNKEDVKFFDNTMTDGQFGDCSGNPGVKFSGWYQNLYYGLSLDDWLFNYTRDGSSVEQDKFIVADVHTIPTDENADLVGWVLHAGTGKLNLAVITTPLPSGKKCSYVGPVNSYYEYISNDFKRLTNKEWREIDGKNPVYRPAFTNLYIANNSGEPPIGDFTTLYTNPIDVNDDLIARNSFELNCKPNPFNSSTVIYFKININDAYEKTELKIFDLKGNLVKTIIDSHLPANNYSFLWFGTDNYDKTVPIGTYLYSLKIGERIESGKLSFVK